MRTRTWLRVLLVAGWVAGASRPAPAQLFHAGRVIGEGETTRRLRFSVGRYTEIDGEVQETTRRLRTLPGQGPNPETPESYTFEELGIAESDLAFGVAFEKLWKWATLRLDAGYFTADFRGEAVRDYYIGVSSVSFAGQTYEYMVIPKDSAFASELDGFSLGARGQFTPVTVGGDSVRFVPWLALALEGTFATFTVDAGPARGVQPYELPPRDYVIGGSGRGRNMVVVPSVGLGGELTFDLGQSRGRPVSLALYGTYSLLKFSGNTDDLRVGSRNDKDLDVDYRSLELGARLQIPVSRRTDLFVGVEYRTIDAEADSRAPERDLEDALARREKYDKHIVFDTTLIQAYVGLAW